MFIPHVSTHTSTTRGSALRFVSCERCGTEYVYHLERTAEGWASSFMFLCMRAADERAKADAENVLQSKLAMAVDAVPCLACGWYQEAMIPIARWEYRLWMAKLGFWLLVALIPVATVGTMMNLGRHGDPEIAWPNFVGGLAAWTLLGIGLIVCKLLIARAYDPNTGDEETRKQLGQSRSLLRQEFERVVTVEGKAHTGH